jgi:hypothetical protein
VVGLSCRTCEDCWEESFKQRKADILYNNKVGGHRCHLFHPRCAGNQPLQIVAANRFFGNKLRDGEDGERNIRYKTRAVDRERKLCRRSRFPALKRACPRKLRLGTFVYTSKNGAAQVLIMGECGRQVYRRCGPDIGQVGR